MRVVSCKSFITCLKTEVSLKSSFSYSLCSDLLAVTYFTGLIYTSIQFAVGNGDCAPVSITCSLHDSTETDNMQFVGHNAFLRWKAIQSVAFEEDGQSKKRL